MRKFWRIVERVALAVFFADLALIAASVLVDPYHNSTSGPGSAGLLICLAVAAFAHHKHTPDIY